MKKFSEKLAFVIGTLQLGALVLKDEAVVIISTTGNRIVAWSDKNPTDAFAGVFISGVIMLVGLSLSMIFRG